MPRRHHREDQQHYRDQLVETAYADYLAYEYRYLVQFVTLFEDFPWVETLTAKECLTFAKELASFEEGDERILLTIYAWRNIATSPGGRS